MSIDERVFRSAADHWRPDAFAPAVGASAPQESFDVRSGVLRVVVALVLVATFWAGEGHDHAVHTQVIAAYSLLTMTALGLIYFRRTPQWLSPASIAVDALLIISLFHEHLLTANSREHDLTATNVAVAFLLLVHAAMSLRPRAVILFSVIFLSGWLSFAAVSLPISEGMSAVAEHFARFRLDAVLVSVYIVATVMLLMLMRDHNRSVERAVGAERQRGNMQRFFAPEIAARIAQNGLELGLSEREVGVMFVDLRSFTSFAESASASDLATVLGDFRDIVSGRVFSHGGTIDKFIGDAVLAVFGAPVAAADSKAQALACALAVSSDLRAWAETCLREGRPVLQAGVGLHHGRALFGVIDSGRHAELTVLGDVVNVAQRLEQATKSLHASIAVSDAFSQEIGSSGELGWLHRKGLRLPGRQVMIGAYFKPR